MTAMRNAPRRRVSLALALLVVAAQPVPGRGPGCDCARRDAVLLRACRQQALQVHALSRGECLGIAPGRQRRECREDRERGLEARLRRCAQQHQARRLDCGRQAADPCPSQPPPAGTGAGSRTTNIDVVTADAPGLGMTCTAVRETVSVNGEVILETFAWYATDRDGNVLRFSRLTDPVETCFILALEGAASGDATGGP